MSLSRAFLTCWFAIGCAAGCAAPSRETSAARDPRTATLAPPSTPPDAADAMPPVHASGEGDAGLTTAHLDREPEELEWDGLIRLARKAEVLRQLPFKSLPEVRIQDAQGIRAFIAQEIDEASLERETKRYRALGLIDESVNLRKQTEEQAQQEVLGYYAPSKKRLVLREDVAYALRYTLSQRENLEWKAVILHELVHALQDQHFDLKAGHERAGSGDAGEAYSALVEGDATLAMLHYLIRRSGVTFESVMADPSVLETLVLSRLRQGVSFAGPPALHNQVPFRYVAGAGFVAALWRDGGWARVNRAFSAPPRASADVLTPERFLSNAGSRRLPHVPSELLTRAGHAVLEEVTLGAIVLTAFLAASGMNADSAVEAWAGDRFFLLEREQSVGYAWIISCIDHSSAADLSVLLQLIQEASPKGKHFRIRTGLDGTHLLVTGNLPDALHSSLMGQLRRPGAVALSRTHVNRPQ